MSSGKAFLNDKDEEIFMNRGGKGAFMAVVIEKGTESDIDALSRLYDEVSDFLAGCENGQGWRKGIYPVRQVAEAGVEEGTLFTVKTKGQIVGSVILNHKPETGYDKARWKIDADYGDVFVVHTLAVRPDWQNKGVGSMIMDFAFRHCREEHAKSIRLDVYEKNLPAIRFYEKCGFDYIDMVDLGLGEYGLNAFILFEKLL